ncbi:unnamed protein product [Effrenium voratum]|uniref:Uncharacterized protein n=1 Tax=Effrenium voratum TaxID=2562239 RepID=A0AA36MWP6_9DINO|nr:unnamed protein product [Effrenium voratum]
MAQASHSEAPRAVRCNARCSLLCGGLTLALAGYACLEPVTALFVPELGWFLLAPGLLALLLGTAGCAASRGSPSKLLEAQLAVFTFLVVPKSLYCICSDAEILERMLALPEMLGYCHGRGWMLELLS